MIHENTFLQLNSNSNSNNLDNKDDNISILLILNSSSIKKELIERLWRKCPIRVCAGKL